MTPAHPTDELPGAAERLAAEPARSRLPGGARQWPIKEVPR
ncbi:MULTISPECIES: hypothetical protein [unclassified Streptomyces]|nr:MULTISPECIES: hypothetical protein [unclassified Streptomyces]